MSETAVTPGLRGRVLNKRPGIYWENTGYSLLFLVDTSGILTTDIFLKEKAWFRGLIAKVKMADELLRRLSVVEFYSGIGGMHFALKGM